MPAITYTFIGSGTGSGSGDEEGDEPDEPVGQWTATPANGSTVDLLKGSTGIKVVCNEGLIDEIDGMQANISLDFPDGQHTDIEPYILNGGTTKKNTFTIKWSGEIYKAGTYKFTITNLKDVTNTTSDSGYVEVIENQVFEPIELTYTVDGSKEGDYGNIDVQATLYSKSSSGIIMQLGSYTSNLTVEPNTVATIYREDGSVAVENVPITTYYMGRYIMTDGNPLPNETATFTIVIPAETVKYNSSRWFNEIRCDVANTKVEVPEYTFTPDPSATDLYKLDQVQVRIDGVTSHEIGEGGVNYVDVIYNEDQTNRKDDKPTDFVKNEDGTYTLTLKRYDGPCTVKVSFQTGAFKINGSNSEQLDIVYTLVEDPNAGELLPLEMTVNPENYADGAVMAKLDASAWVNASDDTVNPGDKGVWFFNYTDANVAEVRYWFEASWNTDWVADNNGGDGYRLAVNTDNGWMAHFWTAYSATLPIDQTMTVHVLALDADGNYLGQNDLVWSNDGTAFTPTLTYSMITLDPAPESTLTELATTVNITSEQALSNIEAYTPEITDKVNVDDDNLPILLYPRTEYKVRKVSDTEWQVRLELTEEYLELTGGSVNLVIAAYDIEGNTAIDALYKIYEYSYDMPAKYYAVAITPANRSTLQAIDKFEMSNDQSEMPGGIGREWNCTEKIVLSGNGYEYAFTDDDIVANNAGSLITVSVPADKQPTEAGVYTLIVPEGFFIMGDETNGPSKGAEMHYALAAKVETPEPETVNVSYAVKSVVDDAETTLASSAHNLLKGQAYAWNAAAPDANWTLTVYVNGQEYAGNASAGAENVNAYTVDAVNEDTHIEALYTLAHKIDYTFTSDTPTGVDEIIAGTLRIGTEGDNLVIGGLQRGDNLNVYTMSGLTVASMVATDSVANLGGLQPGALYIVVVTRDGEGSTAIKVQM